jgi:hypothetical protein
MGKILKKIKEYKDIWPLVVVIIFGLLAGRSLLTPGYFNMHDDLQMMRQLEMEKCFLDGQIPCRWIPDMGYGFGFPLFNFYPPLPYLIGQGIRLLGFSFVSTAKLTFLLSFLVSGVTMYFLAKEFFGKLGGVVSSFFYVWAPYHSVDVYVRGAMNEAWALAWFPLILWTAYRLIKEKKKIPWVIGLALSWFALLTSHNLMVLIFAPVFAVWCLIFLLKKRWNSLPYLAISGIIAFGLAAFFSIPAVLEQKYVHVDTLVAGYYEYIAHYVSIGQLLISRFWGYGPSVWGLEDRMPFQIGHIHWILSLVLIGVLIYRYIKTKKVDNLLIISGFFLLVGWFSAFMTHSRSTPIWQALPPMKFVQFPWRFLTLSTFSFSFVAGSIVLLIKNQKLLKFAVGILVASTLILNWNYFKPEKMGPLTDEEKFSGAAWELQQTAGIFDYLPKSAEENPKGPQKALAEVVSGMGEVRNPKTGTNWASFDVDIESEESKVRIGIFYFPDFRVFLDGKEVETFVPKAEKWGRMHIEVGKGSHSVYLKLYSTPVRKVANVISLVFWLGLVSFPFWKKYLPRSVK